MPTPQDRSPLAVAVLAEQRHRREKREAERQARLALLGCLTAGDNLHQRRHEPPGIDLDVLLRELPPGRAHDLLATLAQGRGQTRRCGDIVTVH